jgi:hypothetical protein
MRALDKIEQISTDQLHQRVRELMFEYTLLKGMNKGAAASVLADWIKIKKELKKRK